MESKQTSDDSLCMIVTEVLEENSRPHAPSRAKAVKVKSGLGSGLCNDVILAAPLQ